MVHVEIFEHNPSFKIVFRNVETFATVKKFLKRNFDSNNVDRVQEKSDYPLNTVYVRCPNISYRFRFTRKQLKELRPFLEELNGDKLEYLY